MPQHKSSEKRTRQTERRRQRNVQDRSKLKTAIKKIRNAPNSEAASAELKNTVSLLDKLAVKGVIHKNKAANLKSKFIRSVSSK